MPFECHQIAFIKSRILIWFWYFDRTISTASLFSNGHFNLNWVSPLPPLPPELPTFSGPCRNNDMHASLEFYGKLLIILTTHAQIPSNVWYDWKMYISPWSELNSSFFISHFVSYISHHHGFARIECLRLDDAICLLESFSRKNDSEFHLCISFLLLVFFAVFIYVPLVFEAVKRTR